MPRSQKSPRRVSFYRTDLPRTPPGSAPIFSDDFTVDPAMQSAAQRSMWEALTRERLADIRERVAKKSPKKRRSPKSRSPKSPKPRSPVPLSVQSKWMSMVKVARPKKVTTLHGVSKYLLSQRQTRMREEKHAILPVVDGNGHPGHALFKMRQDLHGAFRVDVTVTMNDGTEIPFPRVMMPDAGVDAATVTRELS